MTAMLGRFGSVVTRALVLIGAIGMLSPAAADDWIPTPPSTTPRYLHTTTLLPDGRVLVAGGLNDLGPISSVEIYDPTAAKWVGAAPLPVARYGHTATLLPDGKILVAGGAASGYLDRTDLYDPVAGSWLQGPTLRRMRANHTATLLSDGRVLISGGGDFNGYHDTSETWLPGTAAWFLTSSMSSQRAYHTSTRLPDGRVLVIGGRSNTSILASAEYFDPLQSTWHSLPNMAFTRYMHSAVLLSDGRVLVAGGWKAFGSPTSSAEIFETALMSWRNVPDMPIGRAEGTGCLLPDGRALVAGGSNNAGYLKNVDLYDPSLNAWHATVPMLELRSNPQAVLLFDGTVLVTGGNSPRALSSAEIYHVDEAPRFTSPKTFTGTVGIPFSVTITATGWPAPSFAVDTLPPGLVLSGGVISGIPSQAGIFHGSLTATNRAGSNGQFLTFNIDSITVNSPPVANAGPDKTLEAVSPGGATFFLDGGLSFDPDGNSLTYSWSSPGYGTFQGKTLQIQLPVGETIFTLTVDDGKGGISTDTVKLTVVDTRAPFFVTSPADLGSGLLAYWPFDNNARDVSGGGRDLTLHNGASIAAGRRGSGALSFNGQGQYADRPGDDADFNFAGDFSIQTWIYLNRLDRIQLFLEKFQGDEGPGWTWYLTGRQTWEFVADANTYVVLFNPGTGMLQTGTWYHLVLRRHGQILELLQDGQVIYSATTANPLTPTSFPLLLGKRNNHEDLNFDGRLDELAIWNRALSDQEVRALAFPIEDLTLEQQTQNGTALTLPIPPAMDLGDPNVTVTSNAPAIFPPGTTTVTYTATDHSGNKTCRSITVTVADTTPPLLVVQPLVLEQLSPQGTPHDPPVAVGADSCGPVTITSDAPAIFPPGVTIVNFIALDGAMNMATASTTVTVLDTVAPQFEGVVTPARLKLFAAAVVERTPDGRDAIYRFAVDEVGPPILETTISDPSGGSNLWNSFGLTFGPGGDLLVTNRADFVPGMNTVGRITDPIGSPSFAAPISVPGFQNPHGAICRGSDLFMVDYNGAKVTQFTLNPDGTATEVQSFSTPPAAYGITLAPWGELFVSHGEPYNFISRYVFNASGGMVVNGIIFDGGLSQPLGLSFSPWGELFVANYNGNSVSRYSFDPGHNPTAGEPLTGNGMNVPVGVAFSPSGELFVSSHLMTVGWQAPISRWRFGPGHIPLPNGWFLAPSSMGDLKFSPVGAVPELADITIDQTNPEGAWGPMPQAFDQADHSLTITSEPSGFLPLGTTLVTYTARDAAGNVSVATRRVTVQNVRPTAQDVAGFTPEDTPLGVFLFANDTGGETLQYLILTPPTKGTLSGAGPSLIYTPLPDKTGPDSFTWAAFDGSLSSAPAKVQITIMPVNDAPIANGDAYSVNEDGVLTVPSPGVLFNDTDVDGDSLRAFLVSNPAHGNLSLNLNGSFTYRPEPNFHGTDQFSYKANDGTVDSGNAVVMITVNPVNDAPVASNDAYITAEDTPLVVAAPGVLANDSDVDGDPLHAVLFSGPIHGTLTLNPDGSFTYTPAANYNGTDSFTYLASDGSPTPGSATVTLTITPVNDAPVAANDLYTTSEDTLLSVAAPGVLTNDTDVEGTALTAVLVTGPSHGTLTLNANGSFSYTPAANYNGSDSFTYKASDGSATSAVATVNLTVTAVNDAPVAAGVAYTFPEDSTLSPLKPGVLSNASDIDGDTLTAVLVSGPSHGILTLRTDGSFDYTPALNYNGSDSFTFRAKDPSGAVSAPATVNLTITAVNDAPVASGDSYTATKNKDLIVAAAQGVLANDSDVDSITLTATKVAGPSHGTVTLNTNGSFTYTPTQGYVGADSFTYKVSDGLLDSNEATVSIDVQAVNTAPVANDDNKYSFSLKKGNVLDVLPAQSILKNDTDAESDPLTAKLVSGPARGTLVLNSDGSFRYTAAAGETGGTTVTFTYVANDAKVNSNTATVTITINK